MAGADVNGDGHLDIITANYGDNTVSVLLGNGDGSFTPSTTGGGIGLRNTPYLADFEEDGSPDSVVLDRAGNILFRKALPGGDNQFAPPTSSTTRPTTRSVRARPPAI